MRNNIDERALMKVNQKSILYRIKIFFKNLFKRNDNLNNPLQVEYIGSKATKHDTRNAFMEYVKSIEDEETKLLKLQRQYENGEVNRNQLSKEQVSALTDLYKRQIRDLEKSNENRIQKIMQHRDGESFLKSIKNIENEETKLLKLQKQYENDEIKAKNLSINQRTDLIDLYKKQINELSISNARRKKKLLQYRRKMQTAE